MWSAFVDVVRATIFAGSHLLNGSLGASVLVISTLVRLALLPFAVRAARHARANQAKLEALKPHIERLEKRHRNDRVRLMIETQELHARNGIEAIGRPGIAAMLVQAPLLGGLFAAVRSGLGARVRFLWITDLARPDAWLTALIVALTGVVTLATPGSSAGSPSVARVMAFVIMGATLAFLWSASSAVALSVGAGSAVSVIQNWVIRRDAARIEQRRP